MINWIYIRGTIPHVSEGKNMSDKNGRTVMLVAFYNGKALGVRYLERALADAGYDVVTVFFKSFNSINPRPVTPKEMELLKDMIVRHKPVLVGLSVMSSLYIDAVRLVSAAVRQTGAPLAWGGVYASMFPEQARADGADYVIRGEGEAAVRELADALKDGADVGHILNLCYSNGDEFVINDVRPLCEDLDSLGLPIIGGDGKCSIENDAVTAGDPQLGSYSYEITASRGCPYTCSYCCSVNLKRMYKGKGKYVRFRGVDSVITELKEAKAKLNKLKFIRFWDEIFSDQAEWIDEFARRYKAEINLPFEIWGHPLRTDEFMLKKLVSCGLYEVIMGIQSGSPRVRKDVFHRGETQEDIIRAGEMIRAAGVPWVSYDFMLQHPFEADEDIRQTYELCANLRRPFELQLHGLNFLPGTDIVEMAVSAGIYTREQLDRIMLSPMDKQYEMYWALHGASDASKFWYSLTYLTQFGLTRKRAAKYAKNPAGSMDKAHKLYRLARKMARARYYYKKGRLFMRGVFSGWT